MLFFETTFITKVAQIPKPNPGNPRLEKPHVIMRLCHLWLLNTVIERFKQISFFKFVSVSISILLTEMTEKFLFYVYFHLHSNLACISKCLK